MPKRALPHNGDPGPSSSVKRPRTGQRKIEEHVQPDRAINEQASLSSPVKRGKMEALAQEDMDDLEKIYLPHIEAKRIMNTGKLGVRFYSVSTSATNAYRYCYQKPARSGIIQRIELCQFLCHSYLSIDFEDQLNFIVGPFFLLFLFHYALCIDTSK